LKVTLSLVLVAAGAVLATTVRETTGLSLNSLGYLLMVAGVVALTASLAATRPR
jgi:hypothetical protein